ncbi:energy-coupling factor transporter transmembrane component T [Desulfosporosinus meridiei]|uniref:ABC-type cobalt transport system, permease component CbiQ n=1 Tax=Desulfosporosinus meridiei (strain ATCC BAA-275 / DSM 13257 / KCTC 12902 / NCIMB 13706 / S10) TaxID=768704 RepID=J7IL65_DESMD|nr:energy-coupling factor transporter transmembrane component T [Desulfosporosinus meridiei]AFQ42537.1 ABC-type cobalt transport system, permease component CbiQ [Desulfosporosinus meridiei DSM 13257]
MNRAFTTFHPAVSFIFFAVMLIFTMLFLHPVFLGLTLIPALILSIILNGRKGVKFSLLFYLPMFLFISIANPLLNHRGRTVLFYLMDNPITLEAVLYGICSAVSLIAILAWFSCYNKVITADKFLYLFAKISPAVALLITMSMRMTSKLKYQLKTISNAQHTIGLDQSTGNVRERVKKGMRVISILLSWSMEDAIETADSMKARGYGLKNRTTFSLFKFDKRDGLVLAVISVLGAICLAGYFLGYGTLQFYPSIKPVNLSIQAIVLYFVFAALALLPIIIEVKESYKWRSYK